MTDKRDYGIDIARLLSMFMVVVLHNLGQGGYLTGAYHPVIQWGSCFWRTAALSRSISSA